MRKRNLTEMITRMAAYCSSAERCVFDISSKITTEDFSQEEVEQIIDYLKKENFLNETRFANSFVNDKLRFNKWGRIKINYELQKKKIPSEIRNQALEKIDQQLYQEILLSILKDKKKTIKGKDSRDEYNKLIRFALGRGFEMNEVRNCINQIVKNIDYENDLE